MSWKFLVSISIFLVLLSSTIFFAWLLVMFCECYLYKVIYFNTFLVITNNWTINGKSLKFIV